MSKIARKISLINLGNRTCHRAEILVYPDAVKLIVRNEDQYPVIGADCTSEEDAKSFLRHSTGEGWEETGVTEYHWEKTNDGRVRFTTTEHH